MSLYIPQQSQLPSVNINNFNHQSSQTFTPLSNQNQINSKDYFTQDQTSNQVDVPSEECFTVDLSDLEQISFAIWNGTDGKILDCQFNPPCIGSTSENFMYTIPIKDFSTLLFGQNAVSNSKSKLIYPHQILQDCSSIDATSYNSEVSIFAFILQYFMTFNMKEEKKTKQPKSKNKSKIVKPITIVVPTGFNLKQKRFLLDAATLANLTIKNIFTSDIVKIMSLYKQSLKSGIKGIFDSTTDMSVIIIDKPKNNNITVSLVTCELNSITSTVDRIGILFQHNFSGNIIEDEWFTTAIEKVLTTANIQKTNIKGVIFSKDLSQTDIINRISKMLPQVDIQNVLSGENLINVLGGCLLSAAEIDSSKKYVQLPDGTWTIIYQLPVGDNYLNGEVGMAVQVKSGDSSVDIKQLFIEGSKVSKIEHGVLRPMKGSSLVYTEKFSRKSIFEPPEYPVITIYYRSSVTETWIAIQKLYPLSILDDETGKYQSVLNCTMKLAIDPHTGVVVSEFKQGKTETEVKQRRKFWLQVFVILVLLLLIPASYYGYHMWNTYLIRRSHEKWLTDFYRVHAPEKLKDALLVKKTIEKYEGRMFLLWRNLEKTYKKKVNPPPSIVDPDL